MLLEAGPLRSVLVGPGGRVDVLDGRPSDVFPPWRARHALARRAVRALDQGDQADARLALLGALGAPPRRAAGPLDATGLVEAVVHGEAVRRG